MNSDQYINVLDKCLMPTIEKLQTDEFIFQDDNAPCHRSKKVNEWINWKNINRMDWPAQSPDLNPIENLWSILKMKIKKSNPSNKNELIKTIKDTWKNEISKDLIESLALSMKNRIHKVLEAKGGHIPY